MSENDSIFSSVSHELWSSSGKGQRNRYYCSIYSVHTSTAFIIKITSIIFCEVWVIPSTHLFLCHHSFSSSFFLPSLLLHLCLPGSQSFIFLKVQGLAVIAMKFSVNSNRNPCGKNKWLNISNAFQVFWVSGFRSRREKTSW